MPATSFVRQSLTQETLTLPKTGNEVAALGLGSRAIVFGSPGSGKTNTLISTALNLASKTSALEILVITANRYAADKLRDRLAIGLQGTTAGSLARTLPSYAFSLLTQEALNQGIELPRLLTGAEQQAIISKLVSELDIEWPTLASKTVRSLNGFAAELRELISVCLEYSLSPEQLSSLGEQHSKPLWISAAGVFSAYLETLPHQVFDNSSILHAASSAIVANPNLGAEIKQVLVDDAQELTPAATNFLLHLTKSTGLIMFSDPDSSTLGFRAADQKTLLQKLRTQFSELAEFWLEQPIRKSAISNAMAKVVARVDPALAGQQRKGLVPQTEIDDSVDCQIFHDQQTQYAAIAAQIRRAHLIEKIPYDQIAVVARSRGVLDAVQSSLSYFEVPVFQAASAKPFTAQFAARSLLELAEAAINFENLDASQKAALFSNTFSGLDALEIRRLGRQLLRQQNTLEQKVSASDLLAELFTHPKYLEGILGTSAKLALTFISRFNQARELAMQPAAIEQLFWCLYDGSPTAKAWSSESKPSAQITENLNSLVSLFSAANRFAERNPDSLPLAFIAEQLSKSIAEDSLEAATELKGFVPLLTPAGLIGRRFQRIFVPDLIEGIWPNLKPRSSLFDGQQLILIPGGLDVTAQGARSELPDESRLLYKTLGAATEKVTFTFAQSEDEQPSQFFRLLTAELPEPTKFQIDSLNLRATVGRLRREIALAAEDQVLPLAIKLAKLALAGAPGAHPSQWYGLAPISNSAPLTDLAVEPVPISPSQLENFAKCPLHWFLSANGADVKDFKSSLGTILHELFENEVVGATEPNAEQIYWQQLEARFSDLKFDADWLEQQTNRKARRALLNMLEYLQKFEVQSAKVIGREVEFEFELGHAKLRGKVDRIELRKDGSIRIIDLKTSSRISTDKEVRENPQLGSYQLALKAGAFSNLAELSVGANFDAAIVAIGADKLSEKVQPSISSHPDLQQQFESLIERAANEMAMSSLTLEARISSHCENDREFGSCRMHLVKAVSAHD